MQTIRLYAPAGLAAPRIFLWSVDGAAIGDALGYALTERDTVGDGSGNGIGLYYTADVADSVDLTDASGELRDGSTSIGTDYVRLHEGRWWVGEPPGKAELASAVRTELATELARVDTTISSRASQASVDSLDAIQGYNNSDADVKYVTQGDSYDGTANAKLTWTVSKDYTSGWTGTMTVRHRVTNASLMSVSVTAASATQLEATLTTSDTAFADLVSADEFGPHPYDVQMVSGSSEITEVHDGILVIRRERT